MKGTLHLQTEKPILDFETWFVELCRLTADAMQIPATGALRYINIDEAKEWWQDGFTAYVTFRENFSI